VFLRLAGTLSSDSVLEGSEEAGDNVMILQLLSKDQPLHAVIVGQESHHVLQ